MLNNLTRLAFLGMIAATPMAHSIESSDITYDWLVSCAQQSSYTDHIPHFRKLFNSMKVRGFLECGCGYSTQYFINNCDKVVSIEFMSPGTSDTWFKECLELYKDSTNWTPLAYNEDLKNESFNNACAYQCATHKDYGAIDSTYQQELDQYFKTQLIQAYLAGAPIDVAFVDPGVYLRGDMVNTLLNNKVPVIVAHDTASDTGSDVDEGVYGWYKIQTPEDYEKIYIPFGQGTTFWISKSLPDVIESITKYRNAFIQYRDEGKFFSYETLTELADQV